MKVGKFKITVFKMCSCHKRPEWMKWAVYAREMSPTGIIKYKIVHFEHNYAAVLFAFYVARVTPEKVLQRES